MLKKLLKGRPVLYIILLLHVIGLMVYLHYRRSGDAAPPPHRRT